jgi:carboxyl-terminal processing protease
LYNLPVSTTFAKSNLSGFKIGFSMTGKKFNSWLPLLFAIVMVVGMVLGFKLRQKTSRPGSIFSTQSNSSLQEILDLVQLKYVDTVKVDSITDSAINEMLTQLDPHSVYIPAITLQDVNEDLQGNFQGIGVEFNIFNDTVHVISVMENGPSHKAGLQVGDRFLQVNDSGVAGNNITSLRIKKLLRGPGNSTVAIQVLRDNEKKQFNIQRGIIPIPSVDAAYMANKTTGFIHINKFSENTYEEFMKSLELLQQKGMTQLIVDLRDNGGGILQEAVDIADEFLDANKLIVYTEGTHQKRQDYRCKRDGLFETGKLVLLIDEGSASASEVLAGALQDWDRATIIGRRSFGKGLVQEQYDLSNGAALRLTVSRYYTPLGRSIQKPYAKGEGKDVYRNEIADRYHNGSMAVADSNHITNGKVFKTQKGNIVYGGGGIMPDMFVPADTSLLTPLISKLYMHNTISNYAYRYYIQNKKAISNQQNASTLFATVTAQPDFWNGFVQFAATDSVNASAFTNKDKAFVSQRLTALIARQQWRNNGFYEVLNNNDPTVLKALDALRK